MMQLAEFNRIRLTWVSNMVINRNGQTRLLMSTYRTCACPGHICKGCQKRRGWTNMRNTDGPFVEKGKLSAFFKELLLKRLEN
jgi:hypothetical protein